MARTDRTTILKKIMTNYGLFENMFWKYGDDILYDQERELARKILKNAYGKTDIDQYFPELVDMADYKETMNTIFTYYDNQNEWNTAKS